MAIINKQYSFIWYGKCIDTGTTGGGCTSFDLTSGTQAEKIDTVWQVNDEGIAKSWVSGATGNTFSTLECGHSYYIKLKDAGSYNCDITHATLSAYGKNGVSASSAFRITEDCKADEGAGTGSAAFTITGNITETLLEGYNYTGTSGNAEAHAGIITTATEIAKVTISTDNTNHLQYSTNGTNWSNLDGTKTLTQDFTDLQFRTKSGFTSNKTSIVSFVAETTGGLTFGAKTLTFTSTINDVSLSLSGNQTETLEEGAFGTEKIFTITQAGLSSISVTTDKTSDYHVSKTSNSGYTTTVTFSGAELNSSSVSVYVKLITAIETTTKDATITATGTPSNGSTNISDTATITSNVKPRPVINSITIDQSNLNTGSISASISQSNTDGYGAHHWHYTISNSEGDISSSTDIMVNSATGGFGPATITDTNILDNPGNYTITAWIVNNVGSHARVSNLPDKTQNFTIAVVPTSMTLNKSSINREIDLSESIIPSDTITINKANITDVSLSALTNWTATLNNAKTSFTVKYTGSTTITSVTDVTTETLTVTGTKGKRSGTTGTTITQTVTLDATLYKDAEFAISGNKSVIDNRTYLDAPTEHSFTLTKKKNVTYTVSGTLTNWQVSVNEGGYGNQLSALENLSENATFKFKHTGVNANTYSQEKITFTPTQTAVDQDGLGAELPSAIDITLNSTIFPKSTSLSVTTLSAISVEINDSSDASTNSESCTINYPNATLTSVGGKAFNDAVLTGTTTNFSWSVNASGTTFTYWLKDTSTIRNISGESVNIIATADTNYIMNTSATQTTSVSLSGTVAGKATSLGVNDDSTIALGDVEQDSVTTGKKITIDDADNLASATISVSGGGFKISATDGDYGTSDVIITDPLNKDFYIKLDSSGAVGSANSTVTVSGTKSAVGASNPSDVTINCTANITEPAGGGGGADNCCDEDLGFIYSVTTTGGQTSVVNNGLSAMIGFENNGTLCFNTEPNGGGSSVVVQYIVTCAGISGFPSSMIVDSRASKDDFVVRYTQPITNKCFEASVTAKQTAGVGPTINLSEIDVGGGDEGGDEPSAEDCCDTTQGFAYSVDTTGGQTSVVNNGLSAMIGFENGQKLCFNTEPNGGGSSVVVQYIVTCAGISGFPSSMIVDSRASKDDFVVRYFGSDNNCYEASVTAKQTAGVGPTINLV